MATVYKILGQASPTATTSTSLYTVGSGKSAVISTITVANRASTAAAYRISTSANGASITDKDYIAYDISIAANDTTALTLGIALSENDIVRVYASSASVSFNAYGSEIQ